MTNNKLKKITNIILIISAIVIAVYISHIVFTQNKTNYSYSKQAALYISAISDTYAKTANRYTNAAIEEIEEIHTVKFKKDNRSLEQIRDEIKLVESKAFELKLEKLLEQNQFKNWTFRPQENAVCAYIHSMSNSLDGFDGYRFDIYKETADKDIIYVDRFFIEKYTFDIYILDNENQEEYVQIGTLNMEDIDAVNISQEDIQTEFLYENIGKDKLILFIADSLQVEYSNLRVQYWGILDNLGYRKYNNVSISDADKTPTDGRRDCYFDIESGNLYVEERIDNYWDRRLCYIGSYSSDYDNSGDFSKLDGRIIDLLISSPTQEEINNIASLRGLKKLDINDIVDEEIDLSPISELSQLEELYLNLIKISSMFDTLDLSKLKRLKKLYFSFVDLEDISFLSNLYSLEEIYISKCEINDFDLSYIQNLVNLKDIYIENIYNPDLKYFEKLTKLEYLDIEGVGIKNIESIKKLVNLKGLSLGDYTYGNYSIEMDLSILDNMRSLESLSVIRMDITDLEPLAKHEKLRSILLVYTDVEDITPLKELSSLEYLAILGNYSEAVVEQGNKYFSELPTLDIRKGAPGFN